MSGNVPIISVIIPTHNRSTSLRRMLDALCAQTYSLQQVEVLVVADGCTDGTLEMLRRYSAPFALRAITLPGQGAAAARNQGATHATGRLLLFLDDDVEPTPSLIEAHVRAHQRRPGQVAIGPYPPVLQSASFFHIGLRAWWEAKFHAMLQPGHRWTYQDLLSGNFSLEAELFACVGGFDPDPAFQAHEDYELGIRLIKAGVPFTFAADAMAYHHETSDLDRAFRRARQEGRADVLIGQRYPELRATLPLARFASPGSLRRRILHILIRKWPVVCDLLATYFQRALGPLERARLRHHWHRLYETLRSYWYWRGVMEKLGTGRPLANFVRGDQADLDEGDPKIELDLREGLEAAERRLDEERPMAARIWYGQQLVGLIPSQPGAEALRGAHLRPILANVLAVPLLEVLALEGAMTTSTTVDRLKLSKSIRSLSPWFGAVKPGKMWFEQYGQWKQLEREESEERLLREHWDLFGELERETARLEAQRDIWQRLAEERERIIRQQQARTIELAPDKALLE